MNALPLEHETALVTGGGMGLGRGMALALAAAGARVIVAGRRVEALESLVTEIGPERCALCGGDVTLPDDRAAMLARSESVFGAPVTILVNNAGNHLKKPAAEVGDREFQNVMETHVNAGFALARDAYPAMRETGRGSIVFIASMASFMGLPEVVAYTAAKCAVVGLTRALAAEWSAEGIRVNAVAPGWIHSDMMEKAVMQDARRKEKILSRTPLGRFGEADDVGQAVVYLCSPAARFVTGVVLPVDGGVSIGF